MPLSRWFLSALSDRSLRSRLPLLIDGFARGDFDAALLRDFVAPAASAAHSEGLFLNLRCAEDAAALDAPLPPDRRVHPLLQRALNAAVEALIADCETWNSPVTVPLSATQIHSPVPTLILSGAFDPVTPPHWGAEAAARLSRGFHVTIPDAGHWTLAESDCAEGIALAFLEAPTEPPDIACVSQSKDAFHAPPET